MRSGQIHTRVRFCKISNVAFYLYVHIYIPDIHSVLEGVADVE